MARLNEPPVSTDTIETLRRKFLRQNRDIARVNSAQSLRIRSLEGECGRLLSENLTLNGRILELERALEESRSAQRIADHALDIKARMEAQLIEWGAMLEGLGVEPAAKRKATMSPGGRRTMKSRKSEDRSPAATRRPRDSRSAEEVAAMQEGRLPPIHENKTYPRRTMSHAELLAVCTAAADTNDSPDLGPPPTSRFVEEDPVKIDSPTRSTGMLEPSPKISPKIKGEALPRPDAPAQPKLDPKKKPAPATENVATDDAAAAKVTDISSRPLLKAGSKRKFGDENDEKQTSRPCSDKENAVSGPVLEKPLAIADLKNRRNSKGRSKSAQVTESTTMRPRKPFTDKSTNEDLVSPKKMTKSATAGDLKKATAEGDRAVAPMKKRVVPIKLSIPSLPAPSMVKEPHEPATPSADPYVASPSTPETKSTFDDPGDTPPPVDISAHGETSRPSRRVRAAISYAEPSLRDKMRRPTKELYDAVSGEGKYIRSSSTHLVGALSSAKTKAEDEGSAAEESQKPPAAEAAMTHEATRRPTVVSPLLQREPSKEPSKAELPDSVVTERRRRQSSKQTQIYEDEQEDEHEVAGEAKQNKTDPYEFLSTPPALVPPKEITVHKGRITKGMRRSMVAASRQGSDSTENSRPSRKRVSMAPPKKASMLDSPDDDDSTYEASGGETTKAERSSSMVDRTSRRKSMML